MDTTYKIKAYHYILYCIVARCCSFEDGERYIVGIRPLTIQTTPKNVHWLDKILFVVGEPASRTKFLTQTRLVLVVFVVLTLRRV